MMASAWVWHVAFRLELVISVNGSCDDRSVYLQGFLAGADWRQLLEHLAVGSPPLRCSLPFWHRLVHDARGCRGPLLLSSS